MLIIYFALIIVFSLILIKSSEIVLLALKRIGRETKTGTFTLSAIVIALGTSLPELFVGITSSLEKSPNLSLGNVLGANITNISLVAGIAAVYAKRIFIDDKYIRKEVEIALLVGLAPLFFILDGGISRADGLILICIYGFYIASLFKTRLPQITDEEHLEFYVHRFFRKVNLVEEKAGKNILKLLGGVVLLLLSSDIIVKAASHIAAILGIPLFLVGLFILSLGTTLPEIAFSLKSLKEHHPSMFYGNLLGSVIANSSLIIGIVALISPIKLFDKENYILGVLFFLIIFLVFWFFVKSKHRLEFWEGTLLIILYLIFVIVEFT